MGAPLFPDVVVNGEVISSADIIAEAQNHPAPKGKPGVSWRAAARALVVRTLLQQSGRAAGLAATPQAIDDSHMETEDAALIRAFLDKALVAAEITDADCARAFAAHPEQYRAPDLFQASHILFAAKPDDAEARTKAGIMADAILKDIAKNPAGFGRHAKASSDCSSAANDGQLGQLGAGDTVPEFEAAIMALEVGEIAPTAVKTRFGLHIVRLDNMARGRALPYDAVSDQIRMALEKIAWANAGRDLVAQLIEAATIEGIDISEPTAAKMRA